MDSSNEKYYIRLVDTDNEAIYCHHDLMGEILVPEHSHKKAQFLYTEGGIVYVKTPSKTYFLPARHFMWIPAGVKHSIHPSSESVVMRNLYFPVDNGEDSFYVNEGIYPVNELLFQLLLYTNKWNGNLIKDTRAYAIARSLKLLLSDLSDTELSLSLPLVKDKRLLKIINYLNANLQENLIFTEVASKFGFSTRTLHRLFTKDSGISFIQYLTINRMLKAIELLQEKDLPISEIAAEVGYNSMPTFSNTFYKFFGQRPSEYTKGNTLLKKSED